MDGLGFRHIDRFPEQCAGRVIDALFLVPHASDQTQQLDLLTFAVIKQRYSASLSIRFGRSIFSVERRCKLRVIGLLLSDGSLDGGFRNKEVSQ
jgi:hypothetical protein